MISGIQNPKITRIKLDDLAISTELLGEVLQSILTEETKIRFRAPGNSMMPFIRHKDTLTIAPVSQSTPKIGRVVAFIHPKNKNLLIHRIVDKKHSLFLLKGDNSPLLDDGWIKLSQIIGCITSIERNNRKIRFGLGSERYLIAFFSKRNLLTKITRRLTEFKKREP